VRLIGYLKRKFLSHIDAVLGIGINGCRNASEEKLIWNLIH